MLQKRKSNRSMRWSYLSIIPVIAMLILTFSCQKKETTSPISEDMKVAAKAHQLELEAEALTLDPESDDVFAVVEEQPEFPGGMKAMMEYVYTNITYPAEAKDAKIHGMCVVSFIVEKDGNLSNIEIVRDVGGGCGAECVRIVETMPKWKPGKQKGKTVRVKFNLPVKFKLE